MNFEAVSDRLRYLVNEDVDVNVFLSIEARFARERVVVMIEELKLRMEKDSVPENVELSKDMASFNLLLIEKIVTQHVDESVKEFLDKYSLLAYNLACAMQNDKLIQNCQALKTIMDYEKTIVGLMDATKILLRQVKKYDNFKPAAFDISRAYLEQIQTNLKDKNKGE